MKNKSSLIQRSKMFLAVCSLFLFSFSSKIVHEQPQPRNIFITLNVDTGRIVKPNINAFCNFGQDPSISNENFTIQAGIGDNIIWQGVSSSAPDTDIVNITSINYQGGKNIFGKNILTGNSNIPEKVIGTVLYDTPEGQDYKYKISFTVLNNGVKRNGTFAIDPKIQIH
jgi:hypothetical protein